MQQGQIQWNQTPERDSVTTTLTLNCKSDGSIHMESPQSQGGYQADFNSPEEAAQGLVALFEQGIQQS